MANQPIKMETKTLNNKIEQLIIPQTTKVKMNQTYDWFVEKINAQGGSYQVPKLSILAPELNTSDSTLGKYLKQFVKLGLLSVDKIGTKWRYARYSSPKELVEESIAEEREPEAEKSKQEIIDDFKPLATLELDGWEIVDEKGEKWVRSKELARHLEYGDIDSVVKIYERHSSFFKVGIDTTTVKLTAIDGKERETRVFSFTGGLKICRYSEMPKADEVMQQLIDIGDKVRRGEYPAKVAQIDEHIAKWQSALLGNVLQPKFTQIDSNIIEVKEEVQEVKMEIAEVKQTVAKITDTDKTRIMQADIDQFSYISAKLIYLRDKKKNPELTYGEVIASIRRGIKGHYHLGDAVKVTQIPVTLLPIILSDAKKGIFKRLKDRPQDFYSLEDYHQKFLIAQGYEIS